MNKRIYIIAATILSAAFALSCADDMEVNDGNGQERQAITFTVDDSQDWYLTEQNEMVTRACTTPNTLSILSKNEADLKLTATTVNGIDNQGMTNRLCTRAIPQTDLTDPFSFNAYKYAGSPSPTWTTYIYDETATKSGNSWALTNTQYWPSDLTQELRFYGYTPMTAADGVVFSPSTHTGNPYIDFTVKDAPTEQVDLMTAATDAVHYMPGQKAELKFKHALTCVKFKTDAGLTGCTINSLSLMKIVKHGTYDFSEWTPGTATTDFTNYERGSINFAATANAQIVCSEAEGGADALTFLLIPQTFTTDDQQIRLTYTDGSNNTRTVVASLKGTSWLPGTTVTYTLSVNINTEHILTVTPACIGYEGGATSFSVVSYRQSGTNTPIALPWQIIGYSSDGVNFSSEKPEACAWASFHTQSGLGGISATSYNVSVLPKEAETSSPVSSTTDNAIMTYYLQHKPERGTADAPYDLSTHDFYGRATSQNTANCYVINAPGWYKIPLVYGNARKDGSNNTEAYTAATGKTYPDHNNAAINQPYIYANYEPVSATLVWQDANGLISYQTAGEIALCDPSSQYNNRYTYLKFHIAAGNIKPGNAIIAVKNSNGIMWSWHIWVTDADVYKTIPVMNYQNTIYNFMPSDLGWVSLGSGLTYYKDRRMWVKIRQDGGNIAVFQVIQEAGSILTAERGFCPFYQAGRKDPMQPGMGTSTSNRTVYGPSSYQPDFTNTNSQNIPTAIQTPHKFYAVKNDHWYSAVRYDLWCGANTTTGDNNIKVKKTIYDPCPVGFHVPESKVFTGFTATGASTDDTSLINFKSFSNGFYFYTKDMKKTIHLPTCGLRSTSGNVDEVTFNGSIVWLNGATYRWTAIPNSESKYYWLAQSYGNSRTWINPLGGNSSSNGAIIRPIADY